jgi:hypothetical protein
MLDTNMKTYKGHIHTQTDNGKNKNHRLQNLETCILNIEVQ